MLRSMNSISWRSLDSRDFFRMYGFEACELVLFVSYILILLANLRKLKLKEDRDEVEVEDDDTFDDTIDWIESGGPRPQRERKISIIDPK